MGNKSILMVYFSGTGGTKRIAKTFEQRFYEGGFNPELYCLDRFDGKAFIQQYSERFANGDMLVLLYPVYAFDAPEIIYEWLNCLPQVSKVPCVVISVSGGGEVWPNTSSRKNPIKALEKKGFNVFYEDMLVMPPNCLAEANDHLSMRLLNIIPEKVERIFKDIVEGKRYRMGYKFGTGVSLLISKLEKKYQGLFTKTLSVSERCTGCGWCVENCPKENISFKDNAPVFGDKCLVCLRCYYGCPSQAIYTPKYKDMLNSRRYSLDDIEERMKGVELDPIDKCSKGLLWIGCKKYLKE